MASLRLKDILQGREDELGLQQMTGETGLSRSTSSTRVQRYEVTEVLRDRIIPDVILIVTPQYVSELTARPSRLRKKIFQSIVSNRIPLIAISETDKVPGPIASFSELCGITVFTSVYDGFLLESRLSGLLREKLENSLSMHGTLVCVSGFGVMFTGDSGTGKTECSLELAERGHRWIADDAVEIERRGDMLYGRSHELTKGFINIKHRGIVEAKEVLGAQAILDDSIINLMVELRAMDHNDGQNICSEEKLLDIMGVKLSCMELSGFPHTRGICKHVESGVQKLMRDMERGES
jgi:serine kinase of HPr protein (carbohydrate metabolism regulator)